VASLSVPWPAIGTVILAGILIPLLISIPLLLRASRRTVREALDEHGAAEQPGQITTKLIRWLGQWEGVDRKLMVAFRNLFRRQARLLLSVGLLATGGASFVSGLNVMAGFQAIPYMIFDEQ